METSPARGGDIVREMGIALWTVDFTTTPLSFDHFVQFRAWMDLLENGVQPFYAADPYRPYCMAYPTGYAGLTLPGGGAFSGAAVLSTVATDNKTVTLGGLPASFQLSLGDPLAFDYGTIPSRAYHRISETVQADSSGNATFEVRPHVASGWAASAAVQLASPQCKLKLVPKSYSPTPGKRGFAGVITFKAQQTLR